MMKKFDDMSLLEKINHAHNIRNRIYNRLDDELIEYSFDHDYEDDGYFIESGDKIYMGIISMKTSSSLKSWFNKYHDDFQKTFNLKLIRIIKTETVYHPRVDWEVQYTYKDNPRFEEIKPPARIKLYSS